MARYIISPPVNLTGLEALTKLCIHYPQADLRLSNAGTLYYYAKRTSYCPFKMQRMLYI